MSLFANKKRLFLAYGFFAIYAIAVFIIDHYFALAPWFLMMAFFFLIFFPGFAVSRIFKIEFKNDKLGQLLLWVVLGLTADFLVCFLAMVIGFNLQTLVWIYLIFLFWLFWMGLILDILRPREIQDEPYHLGLKDIFNKGNILYFLMFVFIIAILITVDEQGSSFKGDPYFHLVIMRKVLEGQPLLPQNLNFIKSASLHPAYGFPVWHTFLTLIAVLIKSNIFTVWAEISLSLSILVMLTWYWLSRRLMPTRDTAVLAFMIFVVFTYAYTYGYFFTRLPVPDTLCQLLILPLIIAMALKYIFDKSVSYKVLIGFSLLSLLMAAIHFTQYFYFMFTMAIFAIAYLIFKFRDPEFKPIFKRILWALFANLIMVLPFVALLEYHGKVVSGTVKTFWASNAYQRRLGYAPFVGVPIIAKYAYIATPAILLFVKKYRYLVFLFALFVVMPLTTSQTIGFIRYYLIKVLGYIFLNRLYPNVTWEHMVWGLFVGFLLVLFDRVISKINQISVWLRRFIELIIAVFAFWMIFTEQKYHSISKFYSNSLTSKDTISWLNGNYYWIIFGLALTVVAVLIWQKYSQKVTEFFSFTELKNRFTAFLMILTVVFFLFSPNWKNLVHLINLEFTQKYFFITSRDHTSAAVNPVTVGGKETARFIKENIPPKKIFLTDNSALTVLPMLVDEYMAAYPRTPAVKIYNRIYKDDVPIETKLSYLAHSQVEYIFLTYPAKEGEAYFDRYPEYFTKIYRTNVAIFKVDTEKVNYDYQVLVQEGKLSTELGN